MTGIMDHPILSGSEGRATLKCMLQELKKVAVETNLIWSKKLGIPQSKQTTLTKPSGTVSSLMGTSSGIHPRYSPFYIRRVTQDVKDPLTQLMIDQGIPHVDLGEKVIFEFVIASPKTSVCKADLGPLDQLEIWKIYANEWCDGNPSQTIYYDDNSFLDVVSWVYKEWDSVVGLSFFPSDDHIYANAPFQEISEEEYLERVKTFPIVDFSKLSDYEKDDEAVTLGHEIACSGSGGCEI